MAEHSETHDSLWKSQLVVLACPYGLHQNCTICDGQFHAEILGHSYLIVVFSINGAPEEIRTPNLLIRSQMLYPVELRAQTFIAAILAGLWVSIGFSCPPQVYSFSLQGLELLRKNIFATARPENGVRCGINLASPWIYGLKRTMIPTANRASRSCL
jgi:hypothetical protein